jgi:hypothetical protein
MGQIMNPLLADQQIMSMLKSTYNELAILRNITKQVATFFYHTSMLGQISDLGWWTSNANWMSEAKNEHNFFKIKSTFIS